jgi:hypothetical protein
LFNEGFKGKYKELTEKDLNPKISNIIIQIQNSLNIANYNHYVPANTLIKKGADIKDFSVDTINRFEKMFIEINSLFIEKS